MQIPSSENVCSELNPFEIFSLIATILTKQEQKESEIISTTSFFFFFFFFSFLHALQKKLMHKRMLTNSETNFKLKLRSLLFKETIFSLLDVHCKCSFLLFLQELEDPKASLTENDPIPLNEYRRNKLMRLSEMLRNKRNRFDDDLEENR